MEQSSFEVINIDADPINHGKPICVLEFEEQKNGDKIRYDKEALENILLNEHVKDYKIMAVSIVGAFRKGKSLMTNFFLRYLYAHVSKIKNF